MLIPTSIKYEKKGTRKRAYFICICDCGSQTEITPEKFKIAFSCGCKKKERIAEIGRNIVKHRHTVDVSKGGKPSHTYKSWRNIMLNCYHGSKTDFPIVCHEYDKKWETFNGFLDDIGVINDDEKITRIDRQLTWCKENIRFDKRT